MSYLDWLKKREGYSAKPYWDYKQWSVGHGTRASGPNDRVDPAEAQRRLENESQKAFKFVDSRFPGVDAGTRAALADLTYNAGTKWADSGLGKAVASGNLDEARNRFLQYTRAGGAVNAGLVARRNDAANWIGGSGPDGAPAAPFQATSPTESQGSAPFAVATNAGAGTAPPPAASAGPSVGPFTFALKDAENPLSTFAQNLAKSAEQEQAPIDTSALKAAIAAESDRRSKFAITPEELRRRLA